MTAHLNPTDRGSFILLDFFGEDWSKPVHHLSKKFRFDSEEVIVALCLLG